MNYSRDYLRKQLITVEREIDELKEKIDTMSDDEALQWRPRLSGLLEEHESLQEAWANIEMGEEYVMDRARYYFKERVDGMKQAIHAVKRDFNNLL